MIKLLTIPLIWVSIGIANASPEKPLNSIIKNNNVCIYTGDKNSQTYKGQVYVYIGEVDPHKGYTSTYDKLYTNIRTPINQSDCITIDASNFKSNMPYDVSLDMQRAYATRMCLDKTTKPFVIKKVVNGFECENRVSSKEEKSFLQRLFNL